MSETIPSRWIDAGFEHHVAGGVRRSSYVSIEGRECTITIEARPHHCDRGNYLAFLDARGELGRSIDFADLWPRYYFDLDRAKSECEAWLKKRGQWVS